MLVVGLVPMVHPTIATTNPYGLVSTTVNAGAISGTIEVIATSGGLRCEPTRVSIHGGLPDPDHFSLSFDRINIAGLVYDGIRNPVTARVGDLHGNPVPESTSVWFSAEFGLVQGSAGTDDHGEATVDEITAGPRPAIPGGDGLVRICAQTVGRGGNAIESCGHVMWSGPTIVEILSPEPGFTVPNGGAIDILYRVRDANENPLTGGTSIVLRVTDGRLGGDTDLVLPDTQSSGYTTFSATLGDGDPTTVMPTATTITVQVVSENGNRSASVSGTVH